MPTTVILIGVVREGDKYFVQFDDGTLLEFNDLESLTNFAIGVDDDPDLTQKLCLAYALKRSSDLSNINPIQGKDFIFDLSAGNPIKVQ